MLTTKIFVILLAIPQVKREGKIYLEKDCKLENEPLNYDKINAVNYRLIVGGIVGKNPIVYANKRDSLIQHIWESTIGSRHRKSNKKSAMISTY